MGNLNRFNLNQIIKHYNIDFLFETGTLWGDAVAYALQSPFKKILSVEIMHDIAAKAMQRFAHEQKVLILETDSFSALKEQLPHLNGNIIFWLDAHFPGADAGLQNYDADGVASTGEQFRLPLVQEIEIITSVRKHFKDVFIIDDLRIYENGPYQNGNAPQDTLPKGNRSIASMLESFEKTHVVVRSYLDEGYLLLFPKTVYKRKRLFARLGLGKKQRYIQEG